MDDGLRPFIAGYQPVWHGLVLDMFGGISGEGDDEQTVMCSQGDKQ